MARYFRDNLPVDTDNEKFEAFQPRLWKVGLDKLKQKPGLIPPAPKISILKHRNLSQKS